MQAEIDERLTLVLLCGLLCDADIWRDVADSLRDRADIRIISFADFESIQTMATHVLKSIPGRFALAGHSMGGRVALEVVRQASDRVVALALLNTGVHPPTPHEPESRGRLVNIARNHGMTALAAEWLPPMLGRPLTAAEPLMIRLTRMVARSSPDSFAAQIRALLHRPDARAVLRDIRVPLLLLSASDDRWSPPKQHEAMRDSCADSELVIVEGAGHMAPVEQPQAVSAALRAWMGRIAPVARPEAALTDLDRVLITDACTRQLFRYARLHDAAEHEAVAALFTQDGILARASQPDRLLTGRAEILASLRSRAPRLTRHVVSNVEVLAQSSEHACASSTVVLYSSGASDPAAGIATISVGSFHDVLRKVAGEWLFAERRGSVTMRSIA
jgi:pimeloyl-ACP methyl ester carboxylesterase